MLIQKKSQSLNVKESLKIIHTPRHANASNQRVYEA